MPRSPDPARRTVLGLALTLAVIPGLTAIAGIPEGRADLGRFDPRLGGIHAPTGFQVRVIAAEPGLGSPRAMAIDDSGDLYVAEWSRADRTFDVWETLTLPEGGTARIHRKRKTQLDRVQRLRDLDGDGVFESAETVVEGVEFPSAILPIKGGLLLACSGRLERWSDEDGDGRFETRTVLIDGFPASGGSMLDGLTLGPDGWLYLTTGDGDARVIGPDGARVDLARTGGLYRSRPDGSRLKLLSRGFRGLNGGVAFDGSGEPIAIDDDPADGSKLQGARLIQPAEDGDYGWRLRPGSSTKADFDRAAADGDRPGKLPPLARIGRGSPAGPLVYRGVALPAVLKGAIVFPDAHRHAVRVLKTDLKDGLRSVGGELALMASDDPRFRPIRVMIGPDGAIYVLDGRGPDEPSGRIYRITWDGDPANPALLTKPNHWKRIFAATNEQLVFNYMANPDGHEADRAQRELIDRGPASRAWMLGYSSNVGASLEARILGIQGARQLWNDEVETAFTLLLDDPSPEVRRLVAQSLAWEPASANPRLLAKLLPRLDDPDRRVVREAVLAIGRHAESSPLKPAAQLLRWLDAHPGADSTTLDAFLRSLEKMGEAGVDELALAVRARTGVGREAAVNLFAGLRSAAAAEELADLVKIPDLTTAERLALVRQFPEIPSEVPMPTTGLADWALKHPEADPAVKLAVLDACRLAGNPASSLILALLDDPDESVRLAAGRVAARSRPPGALVKLAARLKEANRPLAEKRAIVRALGTSGPASFATLDATYLATEDPGLRRDTLRSMAESDRARAIPALEAALSARDPVIRADAIRILGEAPASAVLLAKTYQGKTMLRADLPAVLGALRKHDTPDLKTLRQAIEDDSARATDSGLDLAEIRARITRGADPWSGLEIFFRTAPNRCAGCHAVEGQGGSTGPALALTTDPERTLNTIVHHPRSRPGVEANRPARDGRASVTPSPTDDDLSRTALVPDNGPHPERSPLDLTGDEVADLVAFLRDSQARATLKHGPTRLDRVLAIGPFAPGVDKLRIPLDRVDPSRILTGQDGRKVSWTPLEADDLGQLNLQGQLGSETGRAYLAVRLRSTKDQTAALRIASEGPTRIYLDGTKVAETTGLEPRRIRLALRAGWNLVIVGVDREGMGEARVGLVVDSPERVEVGLFKN